MKLSKDEDVGAPFVSHGVCYHLIGSYRGQVPSVRLYVGRKKRGKMKISEREVKR